GGGGDQPPARTEAGAGRSPAGWPASRSRTSDGRRGVTGPPARTSTGPRTTHTWAPPPPRSATRRPPRRRGQPTRPRPPTGPPPADEAEGAGGQHRHAAGPAGDVEAGELVDPVARERAEPLGEVAVVGGEEVDGGVGRQEADAVGVVGLGQPHRVAPGLDAAL